MCFTRKKHYQKKYIKKSTKIYPEPNVLRKEPEKEENKKEQN